MTSGGDVHHSAGTVPVELLVLPGMGHNLPRELWPTFVAAITALADRTEDRRAA